MSHQDAVSKIPKNFINIASTFNSKFTAIQHIKKKIYGIQFHPEVTHTINGYRIIKNFVLDICKIKKNWIINIEKNKIIYDLKNLLNKIELCFLFKIASPNSLFFSDFLIFPPKTLDINCNP